MYFLRPPINIKNDSPIGYLDIVQGLYFLSVGILVYNLITLSNSSISQPISKSTVDSPSCYINGQHLTMIYNYSIIREEFAGVVGSIMDKYGSFYSTKLEVLPTKTIYPQSNLLGEIVYSSSTMFPNEPCSVVIEQINEYDDVLEVYYSQPSCQINTYMCLVDSFYPFTTISTCNNQSGIQLTSPLYTTSTGGSFIFLITPMQIPIIQIYKTHPSVILIKDNRSSCINETINCTVIDGPNYCNTSTGIIQFLVTGVGYLPSQVSVSLNRTEVLFNEYIIVGQYSIYQYIQLSIVSMVSAFGILSQIINLCYNLKYSKSTSELSNLNEGISMKVIKS
jgi:hypothetical protein